MTVADKILQFYQNLQPPAGLPEDVVVMNPYQEEAAWQITRTFYQQYYADNQERIILFGINPGRFGGGITGVPFTDPIKMEEVCGIPNDFDKKPELSSRFVYDMIEAFGGPVAFYKHFYISAMSPLGYIRDGKNLNYYDIKDWKSLFEQYAINRIKEQFDFPINRKIAFSIGQGQNLKFLEALNKKYDLFENIQTVPHPRWVMQYRLKRKDEFIQQYVEVLGMAVS